MSKSIYNNNNLLESTSINYSSFVRIAKILRPGNISFKIKQYYYDNITIFDKSVVNYAEDIYTIHYKGDSVSDKDDYIPSVEDYILIRNTCNLHSIRCAIEIYDNNAYICVPSQGKYEIEFNNFSESPIQVFRTDYPDPISGEDNLIKETITRNTFNDVDWITTSALSDTYLSFLLTSFSRNVELILVSYNYITSYIRIEVSGGDHSIVYGYIDGTLSENNVKFYIEDNTVFLKISNTVNYRIGVVYDSGKHLINETRDFHKIKQISEDKFNADKITDFIPLPHKYWVYDTNSYKYIKPNALIFDTKYNKVVCSKTNKLDVFGRRYDYPYANSFTKELAGNTNIFLFTLPTKYKRKNAIISIGDSLYRVNVFNNNNNLEYYINCDGENLLNFFTSNNKLFVNTKFDANTYYSTIILSDSISDIDTTVTFTEGNIPVLSNVGNSAKRPLNAKIGFQYFDTTLKKPIWWNGSKWVDATGADV